MTAKRRVEVKVVPKASREEVIEREEGEPLVVKVKEPAESGKANKAMLKVLARHLTQQNIRIFPQLNPRR